jgi:hypothetical protein
VTTLQTFHLSGWFETNSDGIATIYLSAVDEGMTTGPGDTPANAVFRPRVLNPEQFSIKRAPQAWMYGGGSQDAAFGQLQLDNFDGAFDELIGADLRDTPVTIKLLPAGGLLTGTAMSSAMTICTGIIDAISSDNEDVVTISFKDTIARLDKSLPTKFNPPFVDPGAANVMVPLTFGACRNVKPLLVDSANRLFQLHDAPISNIARVADKAAALDPHATPPQYTPALSGSGIQLQAMPVGLPTCDCSSFGAQAVIPGIDDVLAGAGEFPDTWSGTNGAPTGWTFSLNTGSSIGEISSPPYNFLGSVKGAQIHSTKVFNPAGGSFGDQLYFPSILQGGSSYRVTFGLYNVNQSQPYFTNGMVGGVMVAMGLSVNAADYITGISLPITTSTFNAQTFALEFTVPRGAARTLYFLFVPSAGNAPTNAIGSINATIFNIHLELLGQFTSLPLSGIPYQDYCTEILVNRAGESAAIFNSAEAANVGLRSDGTVMPWGIHFDQPPNILTALRAPADSFGFVVFTDAAGILRFRRFNDPSDPAYTGTIKADFGPANMVRPISIKADNPSSLTTLFGARRNWTVPSDSDYVTDQATVTQDTKTRFSRTSQFWITSSQVPAGEYAYAISAPIYDTLMDEAADTQTEGDRVVGIWSPKVYGDGTRTTGKRRRVKFTALYDNPAAVGLTTTCAVTDLMYGDFVRVNYPDHGIVNQVAEIVEWTPFPFANKIELEVVL